MGRRSSGPSHGSARPPGRASWISARVSAGERCAADHVAADGHLLDALAAAMACWAFERATSSDEVLRQPVLARIIEPVSKLDSLRVLEEAGWRWRRMPMFKRRLLLTA